MLRGSAGRALLQTEETQALYLDISGAVPDRVGGVGIVASMGAGAAAGIAGASGRPQAVSAVTAMKMKKVCRVFISRTYFLPTGARSRMVGAQNQ